MIVETFDAEFKYWMMNNGINIDNSLFELRFHPPQNFAAYRQAELDTTRAATFAQLQELPHLSKRFALKRFLGLSQEEITENEELWREENSDKLQIPADAGSQLRSVGVTPGAISGEAAGQEAEAPGDMAAAAEAPAPEEAPPAEAPPA